MVEWTALEMRRTLTGTLGSNPSLSAGKRRKRIAAFLLLLFAQIGHNLTVLLQNENKIKNTRHSSGLGVNAKNINSIEPDECLDDSSGTRQGDICCISEIYRQT